MFCYQCEQSSKGTGCALVGVCGKDPGTAALQDLLVRKTKAIGGYAHKARGLGIIDDTVDRFVIEALFTTVTNVNFDPERLVSLLRQAQTIEDRIKEEYTAACRAKGFTSESVDSVTWANGATIQELTALGEQTSIELRQASLGIDIAGLQELVTYGLKGLAAYLDHALVLGVVDAEVVGRVHAVLAALTKPNPTTDELLGLALEVGQINLRAMELLDQANTDAYGHPEPTKVRVTPLKGKAIVVSGHDLKDLEELLKQTEGKGINVYTHGEMLPANAYPKLKAYRHLAGNYGGAWQDQAKEFDAFPGAILMTTNCIQKPRGTYIGRIFTSGLVAWPGVTHIANRDFSQVIEAALAAPGFAEDAPEQSITVGFGRNAVLGVADKVIEAVKNGQIKHFFLIGGCDGAKSGRNYYTDFAKATPPDTVILTLACGKYRFNKLDFGTVAGLPRLLDIGQCNDAYSAIQIAVALAGAFGVGVNDLPLSLILSWYEQKAVAILLTLLSLGIKNIRLGPSLPAFVTPAVLQVLVDKFNIMPIGTVEGDLKAILKIG